MKKKDILIFASLMTLSTTVSLSALRFDYDYFDYYSPIIIFPDPFYRPVFIDRRAAELSAGLTALMASVPLATVGVVEIAKGSYDLLRWRTSEDNDGFELPRGTLLSAGAALIGAVAIATLSAR